MKGQAQDKEKLLNAGRHSQRSASSTTNSREGKRLFEHEQWGFGEVLLPTQFKEHRFPRQAGSRWKLVYLLLETGQQTSLPSTLVLSPVKGRLLCLH